jgi:hypothetical protein
LFSTDDCAVPLVAVGRSDADNQSSIIRQSAGRPKSVLEKKFSYLLLSGLTRLNLVIPAKKKRGYDFTAGEIHGIAHVLCRGLKNFDTEKILFICFYTVRLAKGNLQYLLI